MATVYEIFHMITVSTNDVMMQYARRVGRGKWMFHKQQIKAKIIRQIEQQQKKIVLMHSLKYQSTK